MAMLLLDVVSLDDWRAVIMTALAAAKAGDAGARAWLAQYLIGKLGVILFFRLYYADYIAQVEDYEQ
jgi:hypothetical protein